MKIQKKVDSDSKFKQKFMPASSIRWLFFHLLLGTFVSCNRQMSILSTSISPDEILHVGDPGECNQTFVKQDFGFISTPFYPLGYPQGTSCAWKIEMDLGNRVAMSIKSFKLRESDTLEISEGPSDAIRQRFSTDNPPPQVYFSTDTSLKIKLISADHVKSDTTSISDQIKNNYTFHAMFEREGCGGMVTARQGYISVPSYIHDSHMSHECAWTILAPSNQVIVLQFIQFDLPPGSCLYNNVYISEGNRRDGDIIGSYCEESPPLNEIRSATNVLRLVYRSRPSLISFHTQIIPKVKVHYRVVDMCGGTLAGFSGTIATPRRWIDDTYACNWTISVPEEKVVALRLQKWQVLDNSSSTDYDFLRVLTGGNTSTLLWSSEPGSKPPEQIVAPGPRIVLSLTSRGKPSAATRLRFVASYQAVSPSSINCLKLGLNELFPCDDGHYIDCAFKCDGVHDCPNGADEYACSTHDDTLSKMRSSSHDAHSVTPGYTIFMLAVTGVAILIVLIMVVVDRIVRGKLWPRNGKPKTKAGHVFRSSSVLPPPYSEIDDRPHKGSPPPYTEQASLQPVQLNMHQIDDDNINRLNGRNRNVLPSPTPSMGSSLTLSGASDASELNSADSSFSSD